MTTVVFDGELLASDSRRTTDCVDPFLCGPKFFERQGRIFAFAGVEQWVPAFASWYLGGRKRARFPALGEKDITEVYVFDRGVWRGYYSDSPFHQIREGKWTLGTGAGFATIALLCGRSAPESVRLAMEIDHNSGGQIFAVRVSELVAGGNSVIGTWPMKRKKAGNLHRPPSSGKTPSTRLRVKTPR